MIKDNQTGRDAFSRYLPPEETTQATQPSNHNEKQQSEKRHQATQVSDVSDRCQNVSDNGQGSGGGLRPNLSSS
jgi:hypothetical protein